MSEPVEFPVPPDDLRFLKRVERSRSPPPAQARSPPQAPRLGSAAGQVLRGYKYRGWRPRQVRELQRWAPPTGFAKVVCVCVASVLFALELIYFIACRPELNGRRIRARLITPRDVQRIVYLRVGTARGLLNRVRM